MPRARALLAAHFAAAPDTTEHEIVPATGAHTVFEQLYRETADRVYGLCLRMSGDRERATTLAQDVFVRAWRERGRLQPERHRTAHEPRARVLLLAVKVVLGAERAAGRRRRARPAERDASVHPFTSPAASRNADLTVALRHLPARARAAFVLHDVEGCTDAETAEALGATPAESRAQLRLARTLLRSGIHAVRAGPGGGRPAPVVPHVEDGALGDLADGTLDAAERERTLRHLVGCVPCRARHDGLLALLATARAARSAVTVPPDLWTVVSAATVYAPLVRRHIAPSVRLARVLGGLLLVLATAVATAVLLRAHPAF